MLRILSKAVTLQAVNSALPFLVIPYYVNILGVEGYGKIGVAISIIQYFLIFVEYGFTVISIRVVASSKNKKQDSAKLYANITAIKILFTAVGALVLIILNSLLVISSELRSLVLIGYVLILGQVLTPVWLYVGREESNLLMVLTIIPKVIILPFILLLVKAKTDLQTAMAFQVIPALLTGFLTTFFAIKLKWINMQKPRAYEMKRQIESAWPLFVSSIATSLFTSSTPILINGLSGPNAVGIFLIADKVRQGLQLVLTPISLVVYPRVTQLFSTDHKSFCIFLKRIGLYMIVVALMVSIFTIVFADQILGIVYGSQGMHSAVVLKILSIVVVLSCLNTILATYIFIPCGAEKIYSLIILASGILHICLTSLLIVLMDESGAAIGVVGTEALMSILMACYLGKINFSLKKTIYMNSILHNILKSKI